ncbi:MAG: aspartate kinase [Cyclobacteriaceae bacterium]
MKVFKFGGASIKNAAGVVNLGEIISNYRPEKMVLVVSAMGKNTNQLERLLSKFLNNENWLTELEKFRLFHTELCEELFDLEEGVFVEIGRTIDHLSDYLQNLSYESEMQLYSEVVSHGELLSSKIVVEYLNKNLCKATYLDAREVVCTDKNYTDAHVLWPQTMQSIRKKEEKLQDSLLVTQGFIGSNERNETTTLGREGSDFSGAIFAECLGADTLTVWKDVDGVFNADPKQRSNASVIPVLSYKEAAEMTFYGAKVIHPKTIRPLAESNIELEVKSFINPLLTGTRICELGPSKYPSIYIRKKAQALISFKVEDLSFIDEQKMSKIFHALHELNIKVNLMENSAVSFSICIDEKFNNVSDLHDALKDSFEIYYNSNLELFTIKNYDSESLNAIDRTRKILLEQKSRSTIHVLYAT